MAMDMGYLPTVIGGPAVPLAVVIGVTVPEVVLTTYTVLPLGVMAIAAGSRPTVMAGPGLFVAVSMGVTVPEAPFTTYAVLPSGEMAMATGSLPTVIGVPAVMVRTPVVSGRAPARPCPPAVAENKMADRLAEVVAIARLRKARVAVGALMS
jgi:hypothetical protein